MFTLRMAWRELRTSWRELLFFFVSIAVGIAAIVALRSVIESVRESIGREARSLLGADVRIQSLQPWSPAAETIFRERLSHPAVRERTRSIETNTMVRSDDPTGASPAMVELRAIEPEFPLHGEIRLVGGERYHHTLLAGGGALVRPELLTRLGVEVGDSILIGEKSFAIRGLLAEEPGRNLSVFQLGPRVLIDYRDLELTGLLGYGSRAQRQILLRVEGNRMDDLARDLRRDLAREYVTVRSFRDAEDQVGRRLARAENYLSLAGLAIVILGGLGVWSVVRVFVHQRLKTIAVLKCVGASGGRVLAIYLLEVIALGLAGSLLGIAVAGLGLGAVPADLRRALGDAPLSLSASAALQGLGIGLAVSLLFSLVPLLEVRRVKPLSLLRNELSLPAGFTSLRRLDRWQVLAAALLLAALVGLAGWQAGSLRVGLLVSCGFAALVVTLHFAGAVLVRAATPLGRRAWFPLRHAVLGLSRPGNQTRVILLAVGVGSFFVLGIQGIKVNLLEQFAIEMAEDAPDLFVLDVQQDQAPLVRKRLETLGASHINLVPVLRARVVGVEGRRLRLRSYEDVRERGSLGREYTITYRAGLEANERVIEGRFWDGTPTDVPEVSIEKSLRDRFGIEVGDVVRFDVLGRPVSARVTSVRDVEWTDSRNGGFMFLFRPGTFERAPHGWAGFVKGPSETGARARLGRDLLAEFPNLSLIDLRDVLSTLGEVVRKLSLAISLVAALAILAGVLILTGAVAITRYQRRYETAIYRAVGVSRKKLGSILVLEYGALGGLAGILGSAGALVLTFLACRHLLEIPWRAPLALSLAGVVSIALAVCGVGAAATLDVLRHKPLSVLRAE